MTEERESFTTITDESILKRKIPELIIASNGKNLEEEFDKMTKGELIEAIYFIDSLHRKDEMFENACKSHLKALKTDGKYSSYKENYKEVLTIFEKGLIKDQFAEIDELYSAHKPTPKDKIPSK
jgi:hypothetical protein